VHFLPSPYGPGGTGGDDDDDEQQQQQLAASAVRAFCAAEVEPSSSETDMLQVLALSESFPGAKVHVVYMDGHYDGGEGKDVLTHEFGGGGGVDLHLLYRPGHYDIIYKE
jgi:ubiquitin thioesterase protein OTUB1